MKYCSKCVYPDTRPDLRFDENGVCDACNSAIEKESIDWSEREEELKKVLSKYRRTDRYDCIIPVSGGKDSTFQVLKMLDYGMHPLCVTFAQCDTTPEGDHNLKNIAELGVDHIIFRPNREVYKELFRESFKKIGDPCWPCHVGIFTYPIRVAVNYNIPLIIWGENSQFEYGGPASEKWKKSLDSNWLQEFGGMQGLRVEDWVDRFSRQELAPYFYPSDDELRKVGVTGIFLGYYVKWDARKQLEEVEQHGFKRLPEPKTGAILDYENVDCKFVEFHDYLMWLKYGFGRATTQACVDIRNNRLTREEAIKLVKERDGKLEKMAEFCEFTGLFKEEVESVFKKFSRDN